MVNLLVKLETCGFKKHYSKQYKKIVWEKTISDIDITVFPTEDDEQIEKIVVWSAIFELNSKNQTIELTKNLEKIKTDLEVLKKHQIN